MRTTLMLSGLLVFALAGCHRHMPVGQAHVNEPGAHVISSTGATSIAWSDGRTTRVCTLPSGFHGGKYGGRFDGKKGGLPRGASMGAHGRGGVLDAFLFRLCEARGNGDITAAQYDAAVTEFLQIMKQAHAKPGRMGPEGRGEWRPPGRRKRGPGQGFGPGGMDGPLPGPAEQSPVQQGAGQ
jgi:hypothetical protein